MQREEQLLTPTKLKTNFYSKSTRLRFIADWITGQHSSAHTDDCQRRHKAFWSVNLKQSDSRRSLRDSHTKKKQLVTSAGPEECLYTSTPTRTEKTLIIPSVQCSCVIPRLFPSLPALKKNLQILWNKLISLCLFKMIHLQVKPDTQRYIFIQSDF